MRRFPYFPLLTGVLLTGNALGQPRGREAPPSPAAPAAADPSQIRVHFVTQENPGAVLAIYARPDNAAQPIATCHVACALTLPAHRYYVAVVGKRPHRAQTPLELREDQTIVVYEHDRSARRTGLALGLVGLPITLAGVVLTGWGALGVLFACGLDSGRCDRTGAEVAMGSGLLVTAGGIAATATGWTLYARGLLPALEPVADQRQARSLSPIVAAQSGSVGGVAGSRRGVPPPPRWEVRAGLIPSASGVMAGLAARF